MKNIAMFLILSSICFPLKAQVSGYKGKKNVLTVSSQAAFWYSPNSAYATVDYTRVIARNKAVVLQTRMTMMNEMYTDEIRNKVNILQIGVFYEIYGKKDWGLAPIGFKHRFGIMHTKADYNTITTSNTAHPNSPSLKLATKNGTTGEYSWQSLAYEIAYRKPISGNLCTVIGLGIEIPLAPLYNDIEEKNQLITSSIISRILSLGLSYVF